MPSRCVIITLLAFGAVIAGPPGWNADAAPIPEPAIDRNGNPLWAIPIESLGATRARPIFSASRRPPTPPAIFVAAASPPPPPVPAPLPDRPALILLGTIVGDALRVGIFHEEATTKTLRLAVGESSEGWVLRSVSASDAQFEAADRVATLVLRPAFPTAIKSETASEPTESAPLPVRRRRR
jgi:hypothetical protein